jgi:hypothetical protein
MDDLGFTVRLNKSDWDADRRTWNCPALAIPGAYVQDIFVEGDRVDKAVYEVLTGPFAGIVHHENTGRGANVAFAHRSD